MIFFRLAFRSLTFVWSLAFGVWCLPVQTWASLDQSGTHTACLDLGSVTSVGQVKCWLPTTNGFFQRFKVTYWNGSSYQDIPAEGVFGAVAVSGGWYRNTQHEVTFNCFSVSTDKVCFEMDSGGGAPGLPNQAALNEIQVFKPVTTTQHAYTNTYDDCGNRIVRNDSTTGITETHGYDGFNRYIGYDRISSNPTSVDYLLTPEGDRLARLTSTGNTWFINDGSDVLSDYTGSPGSLSPSLFYVNSLGIDDKRIRYTLGGTRHTYNTDHLGTPIQILDTSAKPAKSLRLNAWGEEVPKGGVLHVQPVPYPGGSGFSDRYHWNQREILSESGLSWFRFRVTNRDEGVAYQKDSVLANRVRGTYAMMGNSPLDAIDPYGADYTYVKGGRAYWQVQSDGYLWNSDVGRPYEVGTVKNGQVHLKADFGGGSLSVGNFKRAGDDFWNLGYPDISGHSPSGQILSIHGALSLYAGGRFSTFAQRNPYTSATLGGLGTGTKAIGAAAFVYTPTAQEMADPSFVAAKGLAQGGLISGVAAGAVYAAPYVGTQVSSLLQGARGYLLVGGAAVASPQVQQEAWLKTKLLYEIGQKTLSDAKFLQYSRIFDPIERGRALVANEGWLRAILPEGRGWILGIGKTFQEGPTPGGWLGLGSLGAGSAYYFRELFDW